MFVIVVLEGRPRPRLRGWGVEEREEEVGESGVVERALMEASSSS